MKQLNETMEPGISVLDFLDRSKVEMNLNTPIKVSSLKNAIGFEKDLNFGEFIVGTIIPLKKLFTPEKKELKTKHFWFRKVGMCSSLF
jgi:hypothetical protein